MSTPDAAALPANPGPDAPADETQIDDAVQDATPTDDPGDDTEGHKFVSDRALKHDVRRLA